MSFLILALFTTVLMLSCSGNSLEERCGANWNPSLELEEEITNLQNTTIAFTQDPTTENCEAYKEAYLDYIDGLRDWEDCYIHIGQQVEFNQALDNAQANVESLDCN